MSERTPVFAELSKEAKTALHQKRFGIGWKDMAEILQTIDGLSEDGKLTLSGVTSEHKRSFSIGLPELEIIARELQRNRRRQQPSSGGNALASALHKAGITAPQ